MSSSSKTFGGFLNSNTGPTFNLLISWGLFFGLAVPAFDKYGYDDAARDENYGIPSGPSGSGQWPLLLLWFITVTLIWFGLMYKYFTSVEDEE